MRRFLAELGRRHVCRVAVVYAAAAWLFVQIADVVFENFGLPERAMQILIVGATLGFPLVMVLSWIYDISFSGIRRTTAIEPAAAETTSLPEPLREAAKSPGQRPGLVVLPFACSSPNPVDEMICDGLTEDLTTLLAHMPDFFVISGLKPTIPRSMDSTGFRMR